MKQIVILTTTRAEYGLLKPLMIKLGGDKEISLKVAVTGTHLSPEFGMTVREIEEDGIAIDKKIEIMMSSDTPVAASKSMGLALISFSEYFEECRPDALIVLGDRFETLAVCIAAMNARIPIMHIHGGETTEGAVDEAVRHSITKMSSLHFASTKEYRKRIIQMGEAPERVFDVGALGVENALGTKLMSLEELEGSIGVKIGDNYAVATFHPVTLEEDSAKLQAEDLLSTAAKHPDIMFLFTKANADTGGRIINELTAGYAKKYKNIILVDSLGMRRYLSALKHAKFVIGNSSSGLIEAPSFNIPTIDIGDRQKGRIAGDTVIHSDPAPESIEEAIEKAMSKAFTDSIADAVSPYGNGNTSDKIVQIVKDHLLNDKLDLKKRFHDIDFTF